MNRQLLTIDAALAVLVAALVLIISPGLAVSGIIALVVLLGCGISVAIGRGRRRRGRQLARRRTAASPASRAARRR
jgi:hypothetical protein